MIRPGTILPCSRLSFDGYKVVAVVGYANDFACYQYYTDRSDDECARHGDKLSEGEARSLFPELTEYNYRR